MSGRGRTIDSTTVMSRGEINHKTGAVLTQEEVLNLRRSKGMCITCGEVKTHEKRFKLTGPKMIPLNVQGVVVNGQCLACLKESSPNPNGNVNANGRVAVQRGLAKIRAVTALARASDHRNTFAASTITSSSSMGESHTMVHNQTNSNSSGNNTHNAVQRSGSDRLKSYVDSSSGGSDRGRMSYGNEDRPQSSSTLNTHASTLRTADIEMDDTNSLGSSNYYTTNQNNTTAGNNNNNHNGSARFLPQQHSTLSSSSSLSNNNSSNNNHARTSPPPPVSGFDMASAAKQASEKWRAQVSSSNSSGGKNHDFTTILEFMRKNPEEDALIKGFKEMGRLASAEENRDRVFKETQKLVKSMGVVELHRHKARLVAQACCALASFADTNNEDRKRRIGVFGGVAHALSFLRAQPHDPATQEWGARALASLAEEPANRDILVKNDGVKTLSRAAAGQGMTPEAVEWAIRGLDAVVCRRGGRRIDGGVGGSAVVDPGEAADVVTAVAGGMQHHRENRRVVRWAVRTLDRIWELPDCAGLKAFRPTVRTITNAIKHHEEEIPLQNEALALLVKMARAPESPMGRLSPKGLVEHLHVLLGLNEDNTLHDHFDTSSTPNANSPADLFATLHERAVDLFHELLKHSNVSTGDVAHYRQCADSVGQLMYTHLCSSDMSRAAASLVVCIRIMERMALLDPSHDPNFQILELIMGVFVNHADVSVAVLSALRTSLIRDERHAAAVVEANLLQALIDAVDRHPEDEELVRAALSALETIGGYASASSALDASDVASTVADVLEETCQTEDDALAATALSALRAVLVGDGDGKCDNFTESTLRVVCRVMKTFPKSAMLQFDGCLILRGCLSEDNISMFQCNEDVSEVLFKACEVSEECMKTSNMTIQILFEY